MNVPQHLEKGSRGPAVAILQLFLVFMGYGETSDREEIKIDGDFGGVTAQCLADWQGDNKLEANGKCDPATREEMNRSQGHQFNFEDLCLLFPGTTTFVQEGGETTQWESPAYFNEVIREVAERQKKEGPFFNENPGDDG